LPVSYICSRLWLIIDASTEADDGITLLDWESLRTVKQIAEANPAFSEGSHRWLIYRSQENGLDEVLVRIGRRVLFDLDKFNDWLESHRQTRLSERESARAPWR
jgi:hypothetical protein